VTNLGPIADPLDLLGLWDDADLAVVIDAVRTGAEPGTVRMIELGARPTADAEGPTPPAGSSTHGIGLTGVLRLARAVGRAPRRVVVVGIEGGDFGQGEGLTPEVALAVPHAARHVQDLVMEPTGGAA
jgi:hydrogenase maturation protease